PALALLRPHFYRALESDLAKRLPRPVFLGLKGVAHGFAMRALLERMRALRPDVIHFQWAPLPAVDRWFIPALRRIAPCVLTVHDSAPFNGNPRAGIQLAGAVAIMSQFDRLIVHTEAAVARLQSYGIDPRKIKRLPHGPLDGTATAIARDPSTTARDPAAPVRILLFGRIKPYKGVDVLLRAAREMRRDALAKTSIHIVGQPFMDLAPFEATIRESNLSEHVKLEPRFVADDELSSLLASADVITLPYREIDASGVLMTAISAGVPIVASRVGLFAELLRDGEHGRLIEIDDHLGLARALEQLVLDDALRQRIGANVRALRDQIPSWDQIAELTGGLYGELVEQRKAS
ncbi:MAG TPA: glycosyltransferase family 4 protein, partial [Polyangiales bacterium]|nr:glycosyltransferase family 4 protein [Polyangiales bacterium]